MRLYALFVPFDSPDGSIWAVFSKVIVMFKEKFVKYGMNLVAGSVLLAVLWFTVEYWGPNFKERWNRLVPSTADAEDAEDAASAAEVNSIDVSSQVYETLDVQKISRRESYARSIKIPGRLMEIPGKTKRGITCQVSGVVSQIYVKQGQSISPGQPLFQIDLVGGDGIKTQIELLHDLEKLEAVQFELNRLKNLNRETQGSIGRSRILQQEFEREHLRHTIAAKRQSLMLQGLTSDQIAALIAKHKTRHTPSDTNQIDPGKIRETLLVDSILVSSPTGMSKPQIVQIGQPPTQNKNLSNPKSYMLTNLPVHRGEHVEAGALLCELADFSELFIEGTAFERDLTDLQNVIESNWDVQAKFRRGNDKQKLIYEQKIEYLDSKIDPNSRAMKFFLRLNNRLLGQNRGTTTAYLQWRHVPGQLLELAIPVERFENPIVVPTTAVAKYGLDNYVFVANGLNFERMQVIVLYRDSDSAVLGDGSEIRVGQSIATKGAYQLQLAILNRASGPVDPHAGHNH